MPKGTPFEWALSHFEHELAAKLNKRANVDQPFETGSDLACLRARLVEEEAKELCDALVNGSKEEVLKELCDLLYVTYGTAVAFGLPVEPAFNRVHENNLLKLHNAVMDAGGKLMKGKDHPKVNLKDLV